jgi:hypothetical protein
MILIDILTRSVDVAINRSLKSCMNMSKITILVYMMVPIVKFGMLQGSLRGRTDLVKFFRRRPSKEDLDNVELTLARVRVKMLNAAFELEQKRQEKGGVFGAT